MAKKAAKAAPKKAPAKKAPVKKAPAKTSSPKATEESKPESSKSPTPSTQQDKVIPPKFQVACRFGSGSWNKGGGSLGIKIPKKLCRSETRENYFVNATLEVVLSENPDPAVRQIPGMNLDYQEQELTARVSRYSIDKEDVSVSLSFDRDAMSAQMLKDLACSNGSLRIMDVEYAEDE